MDHITECYYSKMRLFPDHPEILTPGRWQWCPPGAKDLPFAHRFSSRRYDWDWMLRDTLQLGEVSWDGFSSGRTNPRYTGLNYCGDKSLYQQGSPLELQGTPLVDAEGVPLCCRTAGPILGGLVGGGEADHSQWTTDMFWLRNTDLAATNPAGAPLNIWPPAPLTALSAVPQTDICDVVYESPWTSLHLKPTVPFPGFFGSVFVNIGLPSFTAARDFTFFAVIRGIGSNSGFYAGNGSGPGLHPRLYADQSGWGIQSAGVAYNATKLPPDKITAFVWRRVGGLVELYRDGSLLASVSAGAPPLEVKFISCYTSAPGVTGVRVYELGGWPRALFPGEMAVLWDYLAQFGGIDVQPTGSIVMFAMDTPREGYLLCDGTDYANSDHPDLAAYLAGAYDTHRGMSSPGAGRFRVPDYRGLSLLGSGGASANPTTSAWSPGDTGGEESHLLTTPELAAHGHVLNIDGHQHTTFQATAPTFATFQKGAGQGLSSASILVPMVSAPAGSYVTEPAIATGVANNTGGNTPHNNVQPVGAVAIFIKT